MIGATTWPSLTAQHAPSNKLSVQPPDDPNEQAIMQPANYTNSYDKHKHELSTN